MRSGMESFQGSCGPHDRAGTACSHAHCLPLAGAQGLPPAGLQLRGAAAIATQAQNLESSRDSNSPGQPAPRRRAKPARTACQPGRCRVLVPSASGPCRAPATPSSTGTFLPAVLRGHGCWAQGQAGLGRLQAKPGAHASAAELWSSSGMPAGGGCLVRSSWASHACGEDGPVRTAAGCPQHCLTIGHSPSAWGEARGGECARHCPHCSQQPWGGADWGGVPKPPRELQGGVPAWLRAAYRRCTFAPSSETAGWFAAAAVPSSLWGHSLAGSSVAHTTCSLGGKASFAWP